MFKWLNFLNWSMSTIFVVVGLAATGASLVAVIFYKDKGGDQYLVLVYVGVGIIGIGWVMAGVSGVAMQIREVKADASAIVAYLATQHIEQHGAPVAQMLQRELGKEAETANLSERERAIYALFERYNVKK
jgi:hypothetical protein